MSIRRHRCGSVGAVAETTGKLPSSAFFGVGGATPAPDRGIEILGLLIYTYEPNDEMENSALNSPNLRGEIPLSAEKKGSPVCRDMHETMMASWA